jgi:RNA polymerase sigma-70 factor (ECF subfamily)
MLVPALAMIPHETAVPVDEGQLIREIRAGKTELYEYFVRQYQKKITRIAYRFLRDVGEADCAAQESFLRAYQSLEGFREGSTFETWLTRICINWCKDRLKRRRLVLYFHQGPRRDEEDEGEGPQELAVSREPSAERRTAGREIRERMRQAMDALSPRQRSIFVMKHFEEMSIPDIAEVTGLDAGTIKSHLFRAAQKMRERLSDFRE